MTRCFSPDGVPTPDVATYYQKRAEGQVGLILSEGTVINRVESANDDNIPHFFGEDALAGWKHVIEAVHAHDGKMGPQIWHVGVQDPGTRSVVPKDQFEGPSGILGGAEQTGKTMTEGDIADTIAAFAQSAANAKNLGFDMLEIHGAHGYLIDQFFWKKSNLRSDNWGGNTLVERSRFGIEVVKAVRAAVGEDFVISLRLSQWKISEYGFKLAANPKELEAWLTLLAEAGVDIFHCSQREFWQPEYEGSDLNFAGWAKKVTGKPTISVGSVGLSTDFMQAFRGEGAHATSLAELERRLERGDFDLIAVGRVLLTDPHWVVKIQEGREADLLGFTKESLAVLA